MTTLQSTILNPELSHREPVLPPLSDTYKTNSTTKKIIFAVLDVFVQYKLNVDRFANYAWPKCKVAIITIGQTALVLIAQIGKISLIAMGVFYLIPIILPGEAIFADMIYAAVIAPVLEEVVFRGILLTGLEYGQKLYNSSRKYYSGHEPNPTELKAQAVFRVRISAFAFSAIHLLNPHDAIGLAIQAMSTLVSGLARGYQKETTGSLAIPVMTHSFNNILAEMAGHEHYKAHQGTLILAVFAQKLIVYYLSVRHWNKINSAPKESEELNFTTTAASKV